MLVKYVGLTPYPFAPRAMPGAHVVGDERPHRSTGLVSHYPYLQDSPSVL